MPASSGHSLTINPNTLTHNMNKETENQAGELQWTALRREQALELQESDDELFCKIESRNGDLLPVIYTASDKMTHESVTNVYNNGCYISIETADYHRIFGIFKEDTKTANRSVNFVTRGPEAPAGPENPQGPSVPEPRVQLSHEECIEIYNNSLPLTINLQVALSPTGDFVNARWINWPHMYEILEDHTPHLYIAAEDYREFKRLKNANVKLNLTLAKHELLKVLLQYEESLNRTELAGKVQELCQAINAILTD